MDYISEVILILCSVVLFTALMTIGLRYAAGIDGNIKELVLNDRENNKTIYQSQQLYKNINTVNVSYTGSAVISAIMNGEYDVVVNGVLYPKDNEETDFSAISKTSIYDIKYTVDLLSGLITKIVFTAVP